MLVGLSFYMNCFVEDLRFHPCPVDAILVGGGGIESLDVEVLYVSAVVREAPGDAGVVADDNERGTRQSESFRVVIWGCEMNFVPDRGDGEFEMRVVC